MSTESVIRLQDVTRIFDKGIGVMHVDLDVEPGTCCALIGPNGAGKTTTLRLVMGMLRPDSGSVLTLGEDPREHAIEVKEQIGYVAEDMTMPLGLRPCDMFSFFGSLYPSWDQERAEAFADELELPLDRVMGRMSHGQRRQVALLGAIVHRPRLLVLDEPAGGLDPLMRRTFMESVIEILGEGGTTVLLSSHHLDQVERLADRIAFMRRGHVILDRSAAELREGAVQLLVEGVTREQARGPEEVLAARKAGDRVAMTFFTDPARARQIVEDDLGGRVVQERALALEDFFVDVLRGAR